MSELSVLSVGASTPLGLDARQTALMLRAAKAQPRSSPFRNERGNSIGTIRCHRLDDAVVGYERLLALAKPALAEALLGPAAERDADRPTVFLLALPETYEGEDERIATSLFLDLARSQNLRLDERSSAVRIGHAGFAALLSRAMMFTGDVRVVVGAVDSYHDAARIRSLDANFRILSEYAENGFTPGEAAAFALVAPRARRGAGERPLATVKWVACADEPDTQPPMARAMTKLLRDERLPKPVPWVLVDLNGEYHRQREWGFATMRNTDRYDDNPRVTRVEQPYAELGEIGAATGAVYLTYAAMGFRLGFAPKKAALIATSSEGQARGVFYMEDAE